MCVKDRSVPSRFGGTVQMRNFYNIITIAKSFCKIGDTAFAQANIAKVAE